MTTLGVDIGGSSVKAVCMDGGDGGVGVIGTATSIRYSNPDRAELIRAIRECLSVLGVEQGQREGVGRVGLCLPGKRNSEGTSIEISVNLPALENWGFDEMLSDVFENSVNALRVVSDADAAGYDYATDHPIQGRTAAISLGTGVGLCVLDADQIVQIGSKGIGHLGQLDVGQWGGVDRVGPKWARNSLESYIGAGSLGEYAQGDVLNLGSLTKDDPSIQALVQAIKSVHAIYQPNRIVLLGGVGLALTPHQKMITELVNDGLTPLADQDWVIETTSSPLSAARGAAKLVDQSS